MGGQPNPSSLFDDFQLPEETKEEEDPPDENTGSSLLGGGNEMLGSGANVIPNNMFD